MFDCVLNTSLSGFYIFKADKRHTMSTSLHCTKQQVPVTSFFSKCKQVTDLFTFTKEIFHWKLHFLCSISMFNTGNVNTFKLSVKSFRQKLCVCSCKPHTTYIFLFNFQFRFNSNSNIKLPTGISKVWSMK